MPTSTFALDSIISDGTSGELPRITSIVSPGSVSDALIAALKKPKQIPLARVDILDTASKTVIASVEDDVDEGSVTVDVSRGTRRTVQLRIVNDDGIYTPTSPSSYFAFNRLIRVYRGLRYIDSRGGETDEYVLLGTFLVDRAEVFVERNMSVLTVDGSDRWKIIATGGFPSAASFAVGTNINTVIREVAIASGLVDDDLNLDPLTDRASSLKTLGAQVQWEIGDDRSRFLLDFCEQFGLQVYFDPAGYLTTRDIPDPATTTPVWTFTSGKDAIMLGMTKVQNDLKLINHVIVSGENSQGTFSGARAERKDVDPASPTYIGTIGDRVFHHRAPLVTTTAQAQVVADLLYQQYALIDEEIKLPTVCIPYIEGNDVIEIVEPTLAKVNDRYLVRRFDVSLREARMVIETKKGRPIS